MITDYIIIVAIIYFFYKGWGRGFLRVLIGPISLIIGCIAGLVYFHKTQNMIESLLISIAGPIAINIFISFVLKLWRTNVEEKSSLSLPSRLTGSIFSILWSGSYLILLLILIAVVPLRFGWFEQAQDDVLASKSYSLVNGILKDKIPETSVDMSSVTRILQDPKKIEQFQSTKEYQDLVEDERLKVLFSNEVIVQQIENKNYSQLLSNPKIQALVQDEELLKKIFVLNKRIMENDLKEENAENIKK